jgi:protein-disulfide isomerase
MKLETQIEQQSTEENHQISQDDGVFTVSRYTINYFVIAIIFFAIGGMVGYAASTNGNEALILQAVDAAFLRQETALNDLIESGALAGSSNPAASRFVDDDPFIGPEDAPVVIVEFSDFNCSFCKRFHDTTLQPLLEQYEGQVRFVYRDFAILGDTSFTSAMAAECADDQDRFWDYHDLLFENQGNFGRESLISYAEQLELDTEQFTACLDDQTYLAEVRADSAAAQQIGARGTPAFLINDQFVSGAQPLDVFVQIIDAQLAASEAE